MAICEGRKLSERRVCRVLGQHRSAQRYLVVHPPDEDALTGAIVELAARFGRYGYRRITDLLHMAGWAVNAKRVQRIWRAEGLRSRHASPNEAGCG